MRPVFTLAEHRLLADAEEAMLSLTAVRAQIEDGQTILDLGCGWGAFALWAAERFPRCRIFALSNSQAQRAYIEAQASHLRLADRAPVGRNRGRQAAELKNRRRSSIRLRPGIYGWDSHPWTVEKSPDTHSTRDKETT